MLLGILLWIAPALAQSDPQLPAGPPPPGYAKPATEKPEKYEYKFGSGSGALTCFATGTAAEILVNLERCQKMAEQHEVLKEANMELLAQIASLRKEISSFNSLLWETRESREGRDHAG